MAVIILWGFAVTCIEKDDAAADFKKGKAWVAQNFTWLYIGAAPRHPTLPRHRMHRLEHGPTLAGTQNVWCLFLIYLAFSRFAGTGVAVSGDRGAGKRED